MLVISSFLFFCIFLPFAGYLPVIFDRPLQAIRVVAHSYLLIHLSGLLTAIPPHLLIPTPCHSMTLVYLVSPQPSTPLPSSTR